MPAKPRRSNRTRGIRIPSVRIKGEHVVSRSGVRRVNLKPSATIIKKNHAVEIKETVTVRKETGIHQLPGKTRVIKYTTPEGKSVEITTHKVTPTKEELAELRARHEKTIERAKELDGKRKKGK